MLPEAWTPKALARSSTAHERLSSPMPEANTPNGLGPLRWPDAVAAATRDMIEQLATETPAGMLSASAQQRP